MKIIENVKRIHQVSMIMKLEKQHKIMKNNMKSINRSYNK